MSPASRSRICGGTMEGGDEKQYDTDQVEDYDVDKRKGFASTLNNRLKFSLQNVRPLTAKCSIKFSNICNKVIERQRGKG